MAHITMILRETCGVLALVGAFCTIIILLAQASALNKIGKMKRNTHLKQEDMNYLLASHASDMYTSWKGSRILITATLALFVIYSLFTYT